METRVGLISDTHGLMRPEALAALHGVAMILHAGDVGALSVLRELEGLAPVHAVYGMSTIQLSGFRRTARCRSKASHSTLRMVMSSEA